MSYIEHQFPDNAETDTAIRNGEITVFKRCIRERERERERCDHVNELASLSSQEGQELQDLNNTLIKLETDICSIISDCNNSETALIETIEHIPKQLDEMKNRMIEIIAKAKFKMIAEADNFKAEEMKRLSIRTNASSKVNEDIHGLLLLFSNFDKECLMNVNARVFTNQLTRKNATSRVKTARPPPGGHVFRQII
ncbi:hypothetical protein DPMN_144424 [Dreissena polymorpha]|uniref:Uncharacterized protein n=1 Tax=Dreissena polymorpha TaxID=45954 RepID=A0A9D4GFL4_DREPO|nr:hypothetical protein DPMN_144424 [Dreissena polymorpha]